METCMAPPKQTVPLVTATFSGWTGPEMKRSSIVLRAGGTVQVLRQACSLTRATCMERIITEGCYTTECFSGFGCRSPRRKQRPAFGGVYPSFPFGSRGALATPGPVVVTPSGTLTSNVNFQVLP